MKTIIKPEETLECLQAAQNARLNWDEFHENAQKDYELVRDKALKDQRYECAYTGIWLGNGTSRTVHLDHFRKKAIYPDTTFCWHNLFAAAKDLEYGSDYKDRQIHGPKSNADRQYQTFWSPLQANLKDYFWYRQDGTMEPVEHLSKDEKEMAERTIEMYNLNASDLKNKRQGIIQVIRIYSHSQQFTENEIRCCMDTTGFSFLVDFELNQQLSHTDL